MIEYYFLFALGIIYLIVASYEDLKKTEVANWITYSFVAFALAYRGIYSVLNGDYRFFVLGALGFFVFYLIGNLLYYAKAFGGADVKLLRAIGVTLPYQSYFGLIFTLLGFIFLLFFVAFFYTLIYSVFIVYFNKRRFVNEFYIRFKKYKGWMAVLALIGVLFLIFSIVYKYGMIGGAVFLITAVVPMMYVYLKAVDSCMVVLVSPGKLMEGDWILEDINVGSKKIKNTVHGLTSQDIDLLKKTNKDIYVKRGIPFVPAILISFAIMVFFFAVLKQNFLFFPL